MSGPAGADGVAALAAELERIGGLLREAVDRSLELRTAGAAARQQVDQAWEAFLGDFLAYVKQRGRQRGENLFGGLSFRRILR